MVKLRKRDPGPRPGSGRLQAVLSWFGGIVAGILLIAGILLGLSLLQPMPGGRVAVAPGDAVPAAPAAVPAPAATPAPAPVPAPVPAPAAAPAPDRQANVAQVPELAGPALQVNARAFSSPGRGAFVSVVIREAGPDVVPADSLAMLSAPVTIVVRPAGPDARAFAEAVRRAGHEVLVELPAEGGAGAIAPDLPLAEITARTLGHLAAFDVAIGLTAPPRAAILMDAAAMGAVLDAAGRHGFAWIDPGGALDSVAVELARGRELAAEEGDWFADAAASEDQVYAILDNAAAQARRDGSAIVVVTAGTPTLRALVRWSLERATGDIRLAPLSATIMKRQGTVFQ